MTERNSQETAFEEMMPHFLEPDFLRLWQPLIVAWSVAARR
jgi:hypothetical protein